MKKTFLIFGVIGAIYATCGYAGDNQSVVVYTCPDECSVNEDITNCVYADGSDCGAFSADVFMPTTTGKISGATPKSPRNSGPVASRSATEQPVTARAAVARPRANTSKPGAKPTGQDKAMGQGGSGEVAIVCPATCAPDCQPASNGIVCKCKNDKGELCEEMVSTSPNKPISF